MRGTTIDRTNSSLPNLAITNSTTAPTWSEDFIGWYNGNNRCIIGAVFVNNLGAIAEFYCPEDDRYICTTGTIVANGTVSTSFPVWTNADCSGRSPANTVELYFNGYVFDTSGGLTWNYCKVGFRGPSTNWEVYEDGRISATVGGWVSYARGVGRTINWVAFASHANTSASVVIRGYRIER